MDGSDEPQWIIEILSVSPPHNSTKMIGYTIVATAPGAYQSTGDQSSFTLMEGEKGKFVQETKGISPAQVEEMKKKWGKLPKIKFHITCGTTTYSTSA